MGVIHRFDKAWRCGAAAAHSVVMRLLTALLTCLLLCLPSGTASADGFVLQPPVPGATLRGYDNVGRYAAGHRGVDLAASPRETVAAAARGTVHHAGTVAGRPSVSIDHGNGWRTTYLPVHATVVEGEVVSAGQSIGRVAAGHCVASTCLHWGLTNGIDYADPASYLATPPIRLLPRGTQPTQPPSIGAAQVLGPSGAYPVQGPITSRFGMRHHPVTGVYKLHDGVDFGAPCGTTVALPVPGLVTRAGYHGGYGHRVIVDHGGGLTSAYAHLSQITVRPGQRVGAGGSLGSVGSTGLSTGCHLHWMVWRDGALADPLLIGS